MAIYIEYPLYKPFLVKVFTEKNGPSEDSQHETMRSAFLRVAIARVKKAARIEVYTLIEATEGVHDLDDYTDEDLGIPHHEEEMP